mmetsp:Transcript_120040/g.345096  ORF Transcript_120040/g.345096 Transcript_120040/m.345096 type:complete len:97 (+) Transcript_120040:237-527(+)
MPFAEALRKFLPETMEAQATQPFQARVELGTGLFDDVIIGGSATGRQPRQARFLGGASLFERGNTVDGQLAADMTVFNKVATVLAGAGTIGPRIRL